MAGQVGVPEEVKSPWCTGCRWIPQHQGIRSVVRGAHAREKSVKREGQASWPSWCHPGSIVALLQGEPWEGKDRAPMSWDPGIAPIPMPHGAHAAGKTLPHPEPSRYLCYINNEGITEGGNAKKLALDCDSVNSRTPTLPSSKQGPLA